MPANGPVQQYLTEPERLKRFYAAIRGKVTSPGPARPVFRSNSDMMLLTTRLRMDPDGKPHVPGGLAVWRDLFVDHPHGKYDAKLTKTAGGWKGADDVLEALFALTRKSVENEPLKIFLALSDVDRNRTTPLSAEIAGRMAARFPGLWLPVLPLRRSSRNQQRLDRRIPGYRGSHQRDPRHWIASRRRRHFPGVCRSLANPLSPAGHSRGRGGCQFEQNHGAFRQSQRRA